MAARVPPGLADYLVILLSPLLITSMIVSLVFFLIDVLYVGQYAGRLLWTMFFFVGAAVLVARIAIEVDATRAGIYGVVLAGVVLLALNSYLQYAPGGPLAPFSWLINLILMAIVWWSANQLTWDCTHIDEKRDASDQGLIAATGLESGATGKQVRAEASNDDGRVITDVEVLDDRPDERGPTSWIRRYQRARKRNQKKPRTPGVWVVYFSLAAFPLFGLGQSLVPADAPERRQWAFMLMTVYIASGLGLLLTTSFLGLRHYLRKRNLEMPVAMTGLWVGLGAAMVAVFLLVAAFLPRPQSETPLVKLSYLNSKDRDASQNAILDGDTGKGDGKVGKTELDPNAKTSVSGKKGAPEREGKGKQSNGGKNSSDKGKEGDSSKDDPQSKNQNDSKDDSKDDQSKKDQSKEKSSQDSGEKGKRADNSSKDEPKSSSTSPKSNLTMPPIVSQIGNVLKWILFGVLILGVVLLLCYRGLGWLSQFIPGLRAFLESIRAWFARMFGGGVTVASDDATSTKRPETPPVPFRSFANPFDTGMADSESIERLLSYSFSALEAWGRECDCPRRLSETPAEYLARLIATDDSNEFGNRLAAVLQRFANVYQRQAYATRFVQRTAAIEILRSLWQTLEQTPPIPTVAATSAE